MLCTISRQIAGAALLAAAGIAVGQQTQAAQDKVVRVNQIQVIGSHNSYHIGLPPASASTLR